MKTSIVNSSSLQRLGVSLDHADGRRRVLSREITPILAVTFKLGFLFAPLVIAKYGAQTIAASLGYDEESAENAGKLASEVTGVGMCIIMVRTIIDDSLISRLFVSASSLADKITGARWPASQRHPYRSSTSDRRREGERFRFEKR